MALALGVLASSADVAPWLGAQVSRVGVSSGDDPQVQG